jgi:hypothetical protein
MSNEEAIAIVYNLTIRFLRLPVTDQELDALFKVRAMVSQQ